VVVSKINKLKAGGFKRVWIEYEVLVSIIPSYVLLYVFLSPVGQAGERKNGWMLIVVEPFLQPCDWGRSSNRVYSLRACSRCRH
jgi:hypothetical protein